jgi:hypothetical protein
VRQNQVAERKVLHIWGRVADSAGPELISRAFQDWQHFPGEDCATKIEKFWGALTMPLENKSDPDRVGSNAEILLGDGDRESAMDLLDFGSYFLFALRYGFLGTSLEVLLQLTEPDGFHPWFQPLLGRQAARVLLGCHARNAWFVRLAEATGKFIFTYKHSPNILLTTITVNPLRADRRLSADMPAGPALSRNWPSLLYSVLCVNSRECLEFVDLGWDLQANGEAIVRCATVSGEPAADRKLDEIVPLPVGECVDVNGRCHGRETVSLFAVERQKGLSNRC